MKVKIALVGAFCIGLVLALVFGGQKFGSEFPQFAKTPSKTSESGYKKEINALTIYDWWTSPSESGAISKLLAVFSNKYPDVAIVAAPIIGGAGFKMFPTIQSLVTQGEAPDAFQMHAGYEAQPYFSGGLLSQIDTIWATEKLESVIPKMIQEMDKFNGHYYAVPVDVSRSNLIWYNKSVLDKYGIDPNSLTSWDSFFAAADLLRSKGMQNPVQMGESWTAAQVFETVIAGGGIDFYQDWINGKVTSSSDERMLAAIRTYKKYISYTNSDHASVTWDEAVKRIIKGEGAFTLMGDWANGEFKLVGMKYGKDYGALVAPGTADDFGLVVDTFQHPEGIAHPTNSDRWLRVVASSEGQDAFNLVKGSIPARTDVDITKYDPYQQSSIRGLREAKYLYPSVAHGSGAPSAFKLKFIEIIGGVRTDSDDRKVAEDLVSATIKSISDYSKIWSLK